jgi:uncharacterized protein (DUF2141 family)
MATQTIFIFIMLANSAYVMTTQAILRSFRQSVILVIVAPWCIDGNQWTAADESQNCAGDSQEHFHGRTSQGRGKIDLTQAIRINAKGRDKTISSRGWNENLKKLQTESHTEHRRLLSQNRQRFCRLFTHAPANNQLQRSTRFFLNFPDGQGTLVIEATGFRSDQGQALASLFATAEGLRTVTTSICEGKARMTFPGVQWGEYAVSVLHDENGDGVMQNNWLGMATEGHGISMDPESRFGPPDFNQARFVFMADERVLPIRIRYPEKRGPGSRRTQN